MKIGIILGTRPEIIKMSPVIRECIKTGQDFFILHTGQHYSDDLDSVFFEQLNLPEPKYNLKIGSGSHGSQTGNMMIEIEKVLLEEKPEIVLVQGDTNTVLAGALVASKMHILVGHIEAGLRSGDKSMPEEINRILTDHCSDFLFAPTKDSENILLNEGIGKEKVFLTGNTVVDAVYQNLEISKKKNIILDKLHIVKDKYFLVTSHRQENVDNKERFKNIIKGLELVFNKYDLPIIYPMHPRAKKMLNNFKIQSDKIKFLDPIDYLSFLQLESNAKVILTDSGGLQEEACILKIPCVTLRDNTERPETVINGSNMLVGVNANKILEGVEKMSGFNLEYGGIFGNGKSAENIIKIIKKYGK